MINDPEKQVARNVQRVIVFAIIALLVVTLIVGCFTIGTVQRSNEQAARQQVAEHLSRLAVTKSAKAATRTNALSAEQERIRDLAIKNCQALQEYLNSAVETRKESEANANRFANSDLAIRDAFARSKMPQFASLFQGRLNLDLQRAHIARRSRQELIPVLRSSCTLPLQIGS